MMPIIGVFSDRSKMIRHGQLGCFGSHAGCLKIGTEIKGFKGERQGYSLVWRKKRPNN
jgi:hypothetical protein